MAALDSAMMSKVLNAISPVGAAGIPGTWTALGASAMKMLLFSTACSAGSAGTELTGTGYTTGGTALGTGSTASSAGSSVTVPAGAALTWTNTSGGSWTIVSGELRDSAGLRVWFWNWTGQPITIANTNGFQVAIGGVTLGGT